MRKHDFWHVQWFLNGQKWGVKKSISLWPFWRFDNWLFILAKQDPVGRGQIVKKCFFNPLLVRKHDFWHALWFLNGQKWGVTKKHLCMTILKVWQLTLIFGKTRPPGGRSDRKKCFFNPLLMRKHDFWHVQWFLNGQKWEWGVNKKASLYDHFEGLTTDSYVAKQDLLGGGQI